MNSVELYLLGRKLMKIGEDALPKPPGGVPTSVRMVLVDIGENPDSSIGEITARTGFPQSHVSAAVSRLRDFGALVTTVDKHDGRRTLVRVAPGIRQRARRAEVPVDDALAAALGTSDREVVDEVIGLLDTVANHLLPGMRTKVTAS
ncbi:MAG: MarR family winged helix-turn-helix transcriptional regulator [Solirubrobacteraceae bacterium]